MVASSTAWARKNPEKHRENVKRWQRENRDKTKEMLRRSRLRVKYGIEPEDYDRMLAEQGFACAICHKPETQSKDGRFHVDHCHSTDVVRGLLCDRCNVGLGSFGDDPDALVRAAEYLRLTR